MYNARLQVIAALPESVFKCSTTRGHLLVSHVQKTAFNQPTLLTLSNMTPFADITSECFSSTWLEAIHFRMTSARVKLG